MKITFHTAVMAILMTTVFSVNAQSINESEFCEEPKLTEIPGTIIECRDLNSFTAKELDAFEKSDDEILSFCQLTREICLRKKIK